MPWKGGKSSKKGFHERIETTKKSCFMVLWFRKYLWDNNNLIFYPGVLRRPHIISELTREYYIKKGYNVAF